VVPVDHKVYVGVLVLKPAEQGAGAANKAGRDVENPGKVLYPRVAAEGCRIWCDPLPFIKEGTRTAWPAPCPLFFWTGTLKKGE